MLNVPALLPDQTIESVCATAWAMNSWPTWRTVMQEMCGSPWTDLGRMTHSGVADCFRMLIGGGYKNAEDFLEHHGFLSLAKPFKDAKRYEYELERLVRMPRSARTSHKRMIVTQKTYYCAACIEEELGLRGFAYAHRSHQIAGAMVCHLHGQALVSPELDNPSSPAAHGFLTRSLSINSSALSLTDLHQSASRADAHQRFARFIHAALNSQLPRTSHELRFAMVARETDGRVDLQTKEHSQIARVQTAILESFTLPFLTSINASFLAEIHSHIIGILLGYRCYVENSLANLIVLSVFFSSPEDFSMQVKSHSKSRIHDWRGSPKLRPLRPTFSLAKALLRKVRFVDHEYSQYGHNRGLEYLRLRPSLARRHRGAQLRKRHERADLQRMQTLEKIRQLRNLSSVT